MTGNEDSETPVQPHPERDNRRMNAGRFQQQFYSSAADEKPEVKPDPLQQLGAGEKQALLFQASRWIPGDGCDVKIVCTGYIT